MRLTPRRAALRRIGLAGASALAAAALGPSCARGRRAAPGPRVVRVPLRELPPGRRLVVTWDGEPVELLRSADGRPRALLLSCSHFGCAVAWREAEGRYQCPCHDGRFDANGRVLQGPPPRPLRQLPVRIEGAELVLG
ncbi:MAG: ubiquinol-cytochrome c reductase iron-sulfur subunit [Vicinamibacteria bacterium]